MVIFFVQNLPSSHDETEEYSGDDEEVKQATTPPQDKNKTQADKDKVLVLICSKYCLCIDLAQLCLKLAYVIDHTRFLVGSMPS